MYSIPMFYITTTEDKALHRHIIDGSCLFDEEGAILRRRWKSMGQTFSESRLPLAAIKGDEHLVVARTGTLSVSFFCFTTPSVFTVLDEFVYLSECPNNETFATKRWQKVSYITNHFSPYIFFSSSITTAQPLRWNRLCSEYSWAKIPSQEL